MKIELTPIAYVSNTRIEKIDDNWSEIISEIKLIEDFPVEAFDSIDDFSHLEVIFYFDQSTQEVRGSEHPRENNNWPKVGIFAQRKKDRPNHLGLTIVELVKKEGRVLTVKNLDAINGTPILDIKPVFQEFLPKGIIQQPEWTRELMKNYW